MVMPSSPQTASSLLRAAVDCSDPVIYIEHRWLHHLSAVVDLAAVDCDLGQARTVVEGETVTLIGMSYSVVECTQASEYLASHGESVEVIDLVSCRPIDYDLVDRECSQN